MLFRKLFRPGQGQVPQRFIAAFINGTTCFRGDTVIWDTLAPTSQGASGVLEGKTLGANDFIFVKLCTATVADNVGLLAGVVEGLTIGDKVTTTAYADDSCIIVQTWGIHDNVQTVDDTVVAGDLLHVSTVAGAVTDVAATLLTATNATFVEAGIVGVSLTVDGLYTRGTVTTANRVTAFVRADS